MHPIYYQMLKLFTRRLKLVALDIDIGIVCARFEVVAGEE